MDSTAPLEFASTLQSASINWNPSTQRDINPSTSASRRVPTHIKKYPSSSLLDEDEDEYGGYGVVRPHSHGHELQSKKYPPMPDLRFEQSYLKSLEKAEGSWSRIAWITVKDMVLMPFVQGLLYNIALCGWKHWNKNAQLSGNTVGVRLRRWWYRVNNWPFPQEKKRI